MPQRGYELEKSPSLKLGLFLLCTGGLAKRICYFHKYIKAAEFAQRVSLHPCFCCCLTVWEPKGIFGGSTKKNPTTTTTNPGPGIWGLMLPSAECHLFPLAPSGRGAAPELTGWGPGAAEPDGAGQLSRRCNTASWERSQFTRPCLWLADRLHLTCRPAAKRFSELSENSKCPRSWERCPGCIWDFYMLYFLLNLGRESLVTCAGRWWCTEHCSVLRHADATDAGLKKIPQTRSHFSIRFYLAEGSTEMNGGGRGTEQPFPRREMAELSARRRWKAEIKGTEQKDWNPSAGSPPWRSPWLPADKLNSSMKESVQHLVPEPTLHQGDVKVD